MSDASSSPSRSVPLAVTLLADHLDAALAAGEDLAKVSYSWSGPPPQTRSEIETMRSGQRDAVEELKTFELALIARVLKGREWAAKVAVDDERFGRFAHLYVAGTVAFLDAVAECGDNTASDFDSGTDLTAYVRSRGLIAEEAPALSDTAPLKADDNFLVAKRIPLGVLLDLVASFLDALDAEFDLYPEPKSKGGQAISPPAPVPLQ
jgi:hypothetical protein